MRKKTARASWEITKTGLGERIRQYRNALGLTQEGLANEIGASFSQISRWEKEHMRPRGANLQALADAFNISISELTTGSAVRSEGISPADAYVRREERDRENPKPVRIADIRIENVFLMVGNHVEPLEIDAVYNPKPIEIPRKIRQVYDQLIEIKRSDARRAGFPFFNGPNTRLIKADTDRDCRLIRATEQNTRQLPTGEERRGVVLELGPVSWEEYTALNAFLDHDVFPNERASTIRKCFAHNHLVYEHSPDLRVIPLSNILTVLVTPITSDGYALIQRRGLHGVSDDFGLLAPGVNENIHRFLDEAPPGNLGYRMNTVDDSRSRDVGPNYQPTGVPSPLLAAQRGVYEEISQELHRHTKDNPQRYKFLNVIFDFVFFQPAIVGILELELSRAELKRMIEEHPGKDHSEHVGHEFLRLDADNPQTSRLLHQQRRWWSASLSALASAIHYWNRSSRN